MATSGKPPARQPNRTIELHIPSELGWERVAMDLAASVARKMGFPPDRVEDIKTAVAEAALNAIEHGNALDASRKVLMVPVPEDETLEIKLRDRSSTPFAETVKSGAPPS